MAETEVEGGVLLLRREAALPLQVGLAGMVARKAQRLRDHCALTVPEQPHDKDVKTALSCTREDPELS